MDVILDLADDYIFDNLYAYLLPSPPLPQMLNNLNLNSSSTLTSTSTDYTSTYFHPSTTSLLPRDSALRQTISLFWIAGLGAAALYFLFCTLSYYLVFDRRLEHHPRYLKNQVRQEIYSSLIAIPTIDILTLPWFLFEVRGYSKMYTNVSEYGWTYLVASVVGYLLFTDFMIYWIHRLEHHPRIYKFIHKPHHKWIGELNGWL